MTLKAIQKKALLAYYERHTGKSSNGGESFSFPSSTSPKKEGVQDSSGSSSNKSSISGASSHNSLEGFTSSSMSLTLPREAGSSSRTKSNQGSPEDPHPHQGFPQVRKDCLRSSADPHSSRSRPLPSSHSAAMTSSQTNSNHCASGPGSHTSSHDPTHVSKTLSL
jgi:hypothetical protein